MNQDLLYLLNQVPLEINSEYMPNNCEKQLFSDQLLSNQLIQIFAIISVITYLLADRIEPLSYYDETSKSRKPDIMRVLLASSIMAFFLESMHI